MKRLNQAKIAEELGISKSYLSMILSGQRKCPPELEKPIRSQLPVNSSFTICGSGKALAKEAESRSLKE